jgi:hypothetical protein
VQALCNFTIWMAQPTWREPGNAASGAALWTYAGVIAALYTTCPAVQDPNGEDVEGAVSEEQFKCIQDENTKKGEKYTEQLRKHIIEHRATYNTLPEVGNRR